MFFPYRDNPNKPGIPWVTWGMILILAGIFFFVAVPGLHTPVQDNDPALQEYLNLTPVGQRPDKPLTSYDMTVHRHGFRPSDPVPADWFTSLFLHASWPHLLINLLGLWIFGDNVEKRLGWWKYLLVYFGVALVATATHALFTHTPQAPMVGASGAIYGILGLYFLWFPKNQVHTLVLVLPVIAQNIRIPARYVLAFFLIVNNLVPFVVGSPMMPAVAYGSHIGGFLAGLLLALILGAPDTREGRKAPVLADVEMFLRLGFPRRAADCFLRMSNPGRDQVPAPALVTLAEDLCRSGAYEQSLQVYRHLLADSKGEEGIRERARTGLAALRDRARQVRS